MSVRARRYLTGQVTLSDLCMFSNVRFSGQIVFIIITIIVNIFAKSVTFCADTNVVLTCDACLL